MAKQKGPGGRNYTAEFMREVRQAWVAGLSDREVAELYGMKEVLVGKWRRAKKPDGVDWREERKRAARIRAEQAGADFEGVPVSVSGQRRRLAREMWEVLIACRAALVGEELYDVEGRRIEKVYTEAGEEIQLAFTPRDAGQAMKGLDLSVRMLSAQLGALAKMEEDQETRLEEQKMLVWAVAQAVERVFGKGSWERLRYVVLDALGAVADESKLSSALKEENNGLGLARIIDVEGEVS